MAITIERTETGQRGGLQYRGLRSWLDEVERMGQLRVVHGANAEEEIGAATDVLQHANESPAAMFDQVPGYAPDFRVFVNGFGSTDRIALTLGLPLGLPKAELCETWRTRIKDLKPIPPVEVSDAPVMENVRRGDEIDMTIFPAPKWHPDDGGRYIGTGSVEITRGPVTGLPIPADAEIAVEGFATTQELLVEGPFGEWTGYYGSASREEPVLHVEALYYRNQPILVGSPPGQPPDEQARYRALLRSALLRDDLEKAGIPDVVGAWQHEVGGSRLFTVVAITQRYPGHARQVLHVASQCHAGAYAGRYVVVVDDDIEPTNLEEVMWALCTRSDPATSIDIIQRAWSTPLDPRIPPERKRVKDFTNSRGLIDATRPWEWRDEFPPLNVPPREHREAARKRWGYLLEG